MTGCFPGFGFTASGMLGGKEKIGNFVAGYRIEEMSVLTILMLVSSLVIPDSLPSEELEEVVVTGQGARARIAETRLGAEHLELTRLAKMPRMFGENDLVKSLAMMPGVRSEGDGGGGFEVRGGTSAQNLIMLDGITLFNPSHVMGVFSTFNEDAISGATLFKGPIPPCYGNALSSVLEAGMSAGNMNRYHASFTVGILAAKASASGPIVRDKLSFAVSARRSYADMFVAMIPKFRGTVMNFYDVTAKLRYVPSENHRLDLSFIMSQDNMAIKDVMGMYWGNLGASLNWTARGSDRTTFTTTLTGTSYSPLMTNMMLETDQKLHEYIRLGAVNEKVNIAINESHALELGVRSEFMRVKSAEMEINGMKMKEVRSVWQNALWGNYDVDIMSNFTLSAGVRLSLSSVCGGERFHEFAAPGEKVPDFSSKYYWMIEPRLSLKYEINPCHSLRAGASRTSQDIHSIRSSATSFPFDRYALISANIKPEVSAQYGVGYSGMTPRGDFDWSVELYYKEMANVYDFRDGCNMFSRISLESIILGGRGRSYGAEFMIRKNTGSLTGWISYTISKTLTRIDGINDGKWYDATNDRRNDITVAATYKFNDRWSASASWVYSSGHPLTAPDVKYELSGITCYYYSGRNRYKTPPTHRLDLSATYSHQGKKLTYEWTFGVYNAYNRYNPYMVYFRNDPEQPGMTQCVTQAMFGIVPSVSYTLKF